MISFMQPKDGPVIEGMQQHEVVYAKDQPQYIQLRTLIGDTTYRDVISRWSPTEEQRKAIAEGADIFLSLSTFGAPLQPIRMAVSDGYPADAAVLLKEA